MCKTDFSCKSECKTDFSYKRERPLCIQYGVAVNVHQSPFENEDGYNEMLQSAQKHIMDFYIN